MPLVNTWIKNEDWDKYYKLASTKQWGKFIHNALNPDVEVITKFDKNGRAHSFDGGETFSETVPNPRKDGKSPTVELKPIKIPALDASKMHPSAIEEAKSHGIPVVFPASKLRQTTEPIPKSFSARKKK